MDPVKESKLNLEKQIVEEALIEFESGKITEEELRQIAVFTIDHLKPASNELDIQNFLEQLKSKWNFFSQLAMISQSEIKENVENEVFDGVLTLAKHGKIEEAVKLAKMVTSK